MRRLLAVSLLVVSCASADPVDLHRDLDRRLDQKLIPMISEVVAFETVAGNEEAHRAQKEWLEKAASELGFVFRDQGTVYEVELPAAADAPVLGLVVHGDIQPADPAGWTTPPFEATLRDNRLYGRGVADDKGPLVQALLAMKSLAQSQRDRKMTVRLLVGTDEESNAEDFPAYLKTREPPAASLILDSGFPIIVGEKAWHALAVTTPAAQPLGEDGAHPFVVTSLDAGLATSIVPDRASITVRWTEGEPDWTQAMAHLASAPLPEGITLNTDVRGPELTIETRGKAAHAGMNLEGGRNALVALANLVAEVLPEGAARDLLLFARQAGSDFYGAGLGITDRDAVWGRYAVNVATIRKHDNGGYTLTTNVRRIPPRSAEELKRHLEQVVVEFNRKHDASLSSSGYWNSEPFYVDPQSPLVQRLLGIYGKVTGMPAEPAIAGGGTYAQRLPNSIAFGMWFPDAPYSGHDVDEYAPVSHLRLGAHVVLETLIELVLKDPGDLELRRLRV